MGGDGDCPTRWIGLGLTVDRDDYKDIEEYAGLSTVRDSCCCAGLWWSLILGCNEFNTLLVIVVS